MYSDLERQTAEQGAQKNAFIVPLSVHAPPAASHPVSFSQKKQKIASKYICIFMSRCAPRPRCFDTGFDDALSPRPRAAFGEVRTGGVGRNFADESCLLARKLISQQI